MSTQVLIQLFGSASRVKMMKLFLAHPQDIFEKADVIKKTRIAGATVAKEIAFLVKIKMIKKTSFQKEVGTKKKNSGERKKKKTDGYILNPEFIYANHLKNLLIDTAPLQKNMLAKKIAKTGKVKLVIASGIFMQLDEKEVDLLIVADDAKEKKIDLIISETESEIGHKINYILFSTDDFKYRQNLYDHLLRDIFDYPHSVLLDKIGL